MFFKTKVCVGIACQLLLIVSHGAAQTTGSVNNGAAGDPGAALGEPPPGGCMPIGVTAAGNMVFPFACKDLIARHRGADEASAPSESKAPPASNAAVAASPEKDALKASQAATMVQPQQAGPENKRMDTPQQNDMGRMSRRDRPGCLHFRSYDPKSETYLDFSGRRQPCRS